MLVLQGLSSSRSGAEGGGLPPLQALRVKLAVRLVGLLLIVGLTGLLSLPAFAEPVDAYVLRYLDAKTPVSLPLDDQGPERVFTAADFSEGKRLFEENCKNCHVGGATLPNPLVPLSLEALKAAVPPRTTIASLVTFLRQPMTYDGSEEAYECRSVSERWMPLRQAENLAGFILRSAEKAPGWGSQSF